MKTYNELIEELLEVMTTSTGGGVAGMHQSIEPLDSLPQIGGRESDRLAIKPRKKRKIKEMFAGCPVFTVASDDYNKCMHGRIKYERWNKKLNMEEMDNQDIRTYAHKNPGKPVIIKDSTYGTMSYLIPRRTTNESTELDEGIRDFKVGDKVKWVGEDEYENDIEGKDLQGQIGIIKTIKKFGRFHKGDIKFRKKLVKGVVLELDVIKESVEMDEFTVPGYDQDKALKANTPRWRKEADARTRQQWKDAQKRAKAEKKKKNLKDHVELDEKMDPDEFVDAGNRPEEYYDYLATRSGRFKRQEITPTHDTDQDKQKNKTKKLQDKTAAAYAIQKTELEPGPKTAKYNRLAKQLDKLRKGK